MNLHTTQTNLKLIIGKFGGADQIRNAVNQLQSLLYPADGPHLVFGDRP